MRQAACLGGLPQAPAPARLIEGARSWGRIASLIETCKMNGVEPYAWLKTTLEKIATGHPNGSIVELIPWNFKPPSS